MKRSIAPLNKTFILGSCSLILLIASGSPVVAQVARVALPKPTGTHAVGTVTYEWADQSRSFAFSSHGGDRRIIPVQLWYPSVKDEKAQPAPYSALARDYRHVKGHARLRTVWAPGVRKAPLVIIAPGRGTARFAYTTLAEELASHGYVAAAVDMPEIGNVFYGSGLVVNPSPAFRPPRGMMGGPYEKVDAFFEAPTRLGLADLEFAIAKIVALVARDADGRFTGRIDCANVGVFGHSLGGRIAGALAATSPRVNALIAMEGIAPRKARYEGLVKAPMAMLCSAGTYPYAKPNYDALMQNRKTTACMVVLERFGHNSVTDSPLVTPERFSYAIAPREGLRITRALVLSFFNEHLRSRSGFATEAGRHELVKLTVHPRP